LQGLWNNLLTPPWGSKYTTNINLQMNYWGADVLNLSASTKPLFATITDLSITGKLTAKAHYNANGWVLHHNTDIWKGTAPINAANHGIWQTGSAWLSNMIWEHFLFTQDKQFLLANYPIMQSASQFYVDALVKDSATGWLISTPSNSPENGGLVAGPTMDHQIIRDLFKNTIAAAKLLQIDASFCQQLQSKYNQIAPNKIGKFGQLQEWLQDIDDTTNTHRHVSHLWGVFPGTDITWQNPKMMQAAKQSLLYRGDDGTGWSLAWKTNLWARFKDGNHAMLMAKKLLSPADAEVGVSEKGGVYKNLFDAHPPFQIDGNFGGAAGIAEMLVQSHTGIIELLPALPDALQSGAVKGLCARGGFEITMKWANGKLQALSILSKNGNPCFVKYGDKQLHFATQKGKTYQLSNELQLQ
jgi:alpha-L-fucosidase 2